MSRITDIKGELNGIGFEVKPMPVGIDEITEEVDNMMIQWYEENHPDMVDELKNGINIDDVDEDELSEKLRKMKAWMKDEEFRAKYLRKKAEHCMKFAGDPDKIDWASPEVELSTINEAWDFFCGNRIVPQGGR